MFDLFLDDPGYPQVGRCRLTQIGHTIMLRIRKPSRIVASLTVPSTIRVCQDRRMSMWSGDLDELSDRQAIMKLEAEFPGWQCFRGTNLLTYGRTHDSPGELVRGEDWTDLRDEIRRAIARSEENGRAPYSAHTDDTTRKPWDQSRPPPSC